MLLIHIKVNRRRSNEPHAGAVMFVLGLDVGSTTVKAVAIEPGSERIIRSAYSRHHGDPRSATRALLRELLREDTRVIPFMTGSAAPSIAARIGAEVVHEVSAITRAVERLHPTAGSAIELGGQDAKLVIFERDAAGQVTRTHLGMNDRCAAGTGATVDRCLQRLGIDPERAARVAFDPARVRPLSTKCGVFAETDLVNLARAGAGAEDLVSSLADAIVLQCLAVLARGQAPPPSAVLLGGPHHHLPAVAAAWRRRLRELWRARGITLHGDPALAVVVPTDALLYAALGAALLGPERNAANDGPRTVAEILAALDALLEPGADAATDSPLHRDRRPPEPQRSAGCPPRRGTVYAGVDAGSTVSKAVAIDADGALLASASRQSLEPISDSLSLLRELETRLLAPNERASSAGSIRSVAITGYGAALASRVVAGTDPVLETIAHARAARAALPGADVVVDVGGQDIKVLALDPASAAIRDFRLSSQCNAGIGMALETTARELGVPLAEYAETAFSAERAPRFGDGCVVFLDADRVSFQRQGWSRGEILAGLARALPRVIWTQVMSGVPAASLGTRFVLQGGVQRNAAAVEAHREWLLAEVPGAVVSVHPHPDLAGALGAALIARDAARASPGEPAPAALRTANARDPLAPPLPAPDIRDSLTHDPAAPPRLPSISTSISVRTDDTTTCRLCPSSCPRSFIELRERPDASPLVAVSGHGCDAGATADSASPANATTRVRSALSKKRLVPDLVSAEARLLFSPAGAPAPARSLPRPVRIGIPRVLSMYRAAPFFRGYLQHLGVRPDDVVFSPPTTGELWRDGAAATSGASDPCFPVKVVLAHVRHLLSEVHDRGRALDAVFVPRFTHALTPVRHALDCASCPVVAASPAMVRAACCSPGGDLERRGIALLDPRITITTPAELRAQMHDAFKTLLGTTREESDHAVEAGLTAMRRLDLRLQRRARFVLDRIGRAKDTKERPAAAVILARPYHVDPGLCHHVGDELRALGIAALTIRSIPRDRAILDPLFAPEMRSGAIVDPFDVRDLLPDGTNSGAIERIWAARFAARHGALGVVDLSSFKCAQDAPTHAPIRALLEQAGTVAVHLHDLDETRPITSLRLRLKTFAHALREKGMVPWSS